MNAIASLATTTSASVTGGNADQTADAGEPGEFRQERAEAADDQRRDREPRPVPSGSVLHFLRFAASLEDQRAGGSLEPDEKMFRSAGFPGTFEPDGRFKMWRVARNSVVRHSAHVLFYCK